ncbi:hypothetical protein FA15DRAFT_696660 [Coprinopsis marcescibilis]|uniref:Uncharacterized protein n=1 Tax=Coprinopsis marcescibilis TaxID=230819 RepID=A0A5C3KYA9_COPMA|nr:hypothetical protein FA15DRAFT_696660 [Coprinopsis marcescibilis]
MERLPKFIKFPGRKNKDQGDIAFRRSVSLPVRNSNGIESSGGRPSISDFVMELGHSTVNKARSILSRDRPSQHHTKCDCIYCTDKDILEELLASPIPLRPRTRPADMLDTFDEVEMLPDYIIERRKQIRAKDREYEEHTEKVRSTILRYRQRLASGSKPRVEIDPEDEEIIGPYKTLIYLSNGHSRSTRSVEANAWLCGGPVAHRPVVHKPSKGAIASHRPHVVFDNSPIKGSGSARSPPRKIHRQPHFNNSGRDANAQGSKPAVPELKKRREFSGLVRQPNVTPNTSGSHVRQGSKATAPRSVSQPVPNSTRTTRNRNIKNLTLNPSDQPVWF